MEDLEFRFTVYENKIHIVNYTKIIEIDKESIRIKSRNKIYSIKGNNLFLEKILDQELLVKGIITKIEVNDV